MIQHKLHIAISFAILVALFTSLPVRAENPGGFIEQVSEGEARPIPTPSEIQQFVPDRGEFTFPAPYNTTGVRLTNDMDCGASDCVQYVGYSYWRNMNNHRNSDTMLIFLALDRSSGGQGPTLFEYNKTSGEVVNAGPLFDSANALSWKTGEGWYFSATQPTKLYVNQGAAMLRYDVKSRTTQTVFDLETKLRNILDLNLGVETNLLDLALNMGSSGYYIWQMHSSNDDSVHSVTVRDSATFEMLGCLAFDEGANELSYFPKTGTFDECQIDKSGRWLVIKENNDNRIIDLENGTERILLDQDGAAGHSDMGYGTLIAQDNWANDANTWRLWDLAATSLEGQITYHNNDWHVQAPNHVSFSNARPDVSLQQQYSCGSGANRSVSPHANEIFCVLMDGTESALVVAPVMTDLDAAGGGTDYRKLPKGNLDVTGEYFIWTTNMGGSRLDAFLVKVPSHLLDGTSGPDSGSDPDPGSDPGSDTGSDPGTDPDTSDTVPPVISITSEVLSSDSAMITVSTDEPADSTIDYGLTDAYVNTSTLSALSTIHTHTVNNLAAETTYHYQITSRDAAGNVSASQDITFTTLAVVEEPQLSGDELASEAVQWEQLINVTSDGNSLQKTAGCDGCADAGASSAQQIEAGDGYLEFTVSETQRMRFVGLASNPDGNDPANIDFAIRVQSGYVEVREFGQYRTDMNVASGDVFRIEVTGGVVSYAKNGDVFYTSTVAPVYPLTADAVFHSLDSSVSNVVIASETAPAVSSGVSDVIWEQLVNVTSDGNSLQKTAGCDGCADAGASSAQQIEGGDGYLEFAVNETSLMRFVGLASSPDGNDPANIDFAIRVQSGYVEVRELGQYRTDMNVASGDVFRIEVAGGVVSYAKNGEVFYTSTVAPVYPLTADAVFHAMYGSLSNAIVGW